MKEVISCNQNSQVTSWLKYWIVGVRYRTKIVIFIVELSNIISYDLWTVFIKPKLVLLLILWVMMLSWHRLSLVIVSDTIWRAFQNVHQTIFFPIFAPSRRLIIIFPDEQSYIFDVQRSLKLLSLLKKVQVRRWCLVLISRVNSLSWLAGFEATTV